MGIVPFPYKQKPYVAEKMENNDRPPVVVVNVCPTLTTKRTIVVSGTIKDIPKVNPRLFVNQKELAIRSEKWLTSVNLEEGENTVLVAATNDLLQNTYQQIKVFCGVLPLKISINPAPVLTYKEVFTIAGRISDPNTASLVSNFSRQDSEADDDSSSANSSDLRINGHPISPDEEGNWKLTAKLKPGNNEFIVTVQNSAKQITKESVTVFFNDAAPEVFFDIDSYTFDSPTPTLSGTITTSTGHASSLKVEDSDVPVRGGRFSTRLKLKAGANKVSFGIFVGSQRFSIDKTFYFVYGSPSISITRTEHTNKKNIYKVVGAVTDANDSSPLVFINGEKMMLKKGGVFNYSATIKDGYNEVLIIAKNLADKVATHVVPVIYTSSAPEIELEEYPDTCADSYVVLTGSVRDDDNSGIPVVLVNNQRATMTGTNWRQEVALDSGENTITIVAAGSAGTNTQISVQINCTIVNPILRVLNCPRETNLPNLTIRGLIHTGNKDDPYAVKVFVNDFPAQHENGKWTFETALNPGKNRFVVTSINDSGERCEVEKVVIFTR